MEIIKILARAFRLVRSEKPLAFVLAFAAAGVASAQLLEPVLFGRVIDSLSKDAGFFRYLGLWGGLGVLNAAFSVFLSIVADRFAHRQRMRAMGQVFERTISLPFTFHSLHGSGKCVRTILAGSEQVFYLFLSFFRENLTALVGIVALVPIAFLIEARLACVLLILASIYAVCNWFVIRRTHAKQSIVELRHQDVAARIVDVIANVTVIRSFTRVGKEAELFRHLTDQVLKVQYPVLTWWGVLCVLTRLSSMAAIVTIVGIGSILVHRGEVSPGQVVTFVGFSTLMIARLEQISSYLNRILGQAPTLKNLFELIDTPDMESGGNQLHSGLRGRVVFENVTFQYREKGQGVFNLNFVAEPGETIALVGPSGAGKTTCLALLQKLFTPQLGRITIDDEDIQDASVESLCGSIATVFQEPGLFNRSIYDNILVGRPSATRTEVEEAARRAEAHEFIMSRPGGYDFVVGERGMALSGGERQRIAIARAILKDASILLLDEATSALDNETEKKIQAAMDHLREGKTTFLIAHRLSTIVNADKVLVMAGGRIIECGTFNELEKAGGLFSRLLAAGQLTEEQESRPREKEAIAAV